MLEVRGLGIMRLPYRTRARLALIVELGGQVERMPLPRRHPDLNLPIVNVNATAASAPEKVTLALDCALGRVSQVAGAFAA
jgi:HPr kinase/phosphorylase